MNYHNKRRMTLSLFVLATLSLAACGGGGGASGNDEPALRSFQIDTPQAEARSGNQSIALQLQNLVQPTITLTN